MTIIANGTAMYSGSGFQSNETLAGRTPQTWSLRIRLLLAVLCPVLLLLAGCEQQQRSADTYPSKPIKLIVPFGAGGGSDTFGRIVQNAIDENNLLPQPLVIVNIPGAGGTIGSLQAKQAKPDGYTLLLLHEGILTAQRAGQATYGPESFMPIAGTGDATQVIAVAGDSPYSDLQSLVRAAAEQPDTLVFSANIGAPSHFAGLMLESESDGAVFRYMQSGGGAKRFAAIQGGHVDVSAFSIAEYVQFQKSGMRALALLGSERNPELPDLATAREQGLDVVSQNMQFWWAPLGTPSERVEVIADAIDAAMQTEEVRNRLADMKISETVLRGAELDDEIERRRSRIATVVVSGTSGLPNFPAIVFGCLVIVSVLAMARSRQRSRTETSRTEALHTDTALSEAPPVKTPLGSSLAASKANWLSLIVIASGTIVYVLGLQFRWLGFVPATAIYASLCGSTLAVPLVQTQRISLVRAATVCLLVAVVMSFVIDQLFTKFLVVDLPR